ncbi:MAG: site-2 protease family protein [Nitrospirae bacterium]|nr:site-2 protease family protein [Nitrospirota bacterium]MDA1303904.1 site-2 protease family protein [Nitrospirota bacterium]
MVQFFHTLSYVILPLMAAVVLHEYAHGWVAHYFGDDTAQSQGRLTLNPVKHIDPFGTIIVPLLCLLAPGGFLFGWAKPVPVNPNRLRNPRRDMALVAAAGPAMNFVLAIGSGILLAMIYAIDPTLKANWPPQPGIEPREDLLGMLLLPLTAMLLFSVIINTLLFAFNLVPIPPLDGGRILTSLLPYRSALALSRIEPYGMFILLGLFFFDERVPIISTFVGTIFKFMASDILSKSAF